MMGAHSNCRKPEGAHVKRMLAGLAGTMPRSFSVCMLTLLALSGIAKADAVLDWNAIAVDIAVANKQNPFAQGRTGAIVQLAVFEAVNSITHEYDPYLGTVKAARGASAEAAAVEAAYKVLSTYFPASLTALNAERSASLAAIADGQGKTDGIAAGDAAAADMLQLRASDGSSPGQFKVPGPAVPGDWQATASCPIVGGVAQGIAFNWQFVVPFGIEKASDYLLGPPPALTSEAYARAYNEVMRVGAANSTERPQDRANVALFFAATSPTQALNQAARQVAMERGGSLTQNARALALMNMAINDSLVASFLNKYHYNFWRPETAIHGGNADGNRKIEGDASWTPFIVTPCFPSYPSNHGSAANAAAEVLRRIYGEAGHAMTLTNTTVPTIVLHYSSFGDLCADISDARVYGGIHFRTDQEAGADLGRAVGAAVYRNNLRRTNRAGDDDDGRDEDDR